MQARVRVLAKAAMRHEQFRACIEACNDCAVACDACTAGCLQERDPKPLARCVALTVDCAQGCRLAAALLSRGSESAVEACELAAQLCESCADECARHDSEHCRECAKACGDCAQQCHATASEGRRQLHGAAMPAGTH